MRKYTGTDFDELLRMVHFQTHTGCDSRGRLRCKDSYTSISCPHWNVTMPITRGTNSISTCSAYKAFFTSEAQYSPYRRTSQSLANRSRNFLQAEPTSRLSEHVAIQACISFATMRLPSAVMAALFSGVVTVSLGSRAACCLIKKQDDADVGVASDRVAQRESMCMER